MATIITPPAPVADHFNAEDKMVALRAQLTERLTALRAEQERRIAELNALMGRIAECSELLETIKPTIETQKQQEARRHDGQ